MVCSLLFQWRVANFFQQLLWFANDVLHTKDKYFHQVKKHAPRRPDRPSARPVNNNRRPLKYNPIEAKRLERLFRLSKKWAVRKVLNDTKPSYTGTVDDANKFFTRVFSVKTCDEDGIKCGLDGFAPSGPSDNHLDDHVTPKEI